MTGPKSAPPTARVLAALRNLAITILRLTTSIATALRYHAVGQAGP